jgi:hypothetical protein
MAIKPGDRVIYCADSCPGYWPAAEPGVVKAVGAVRAWVQFPWGLQWLRLDSLKVVTVDSVAAA